MSEILPSTPPSKLYIPPELLREIFSYCDTATLGNVSRSSKTFLEIASPFLYTHIVLYNIDSVVKLFLLETTSSLPSSPSSTSPSSSIASLPCLVHLSRIRTFTYFSKDTTEDKDDLHLPCDLPSNPPLPIDVFVFNFRGSKTIQDVQRVPQVATVFNLFNPTSFVLRGSGQVVGQDLTFQQLQFGPFMSHFDVLFYLPSWNRLTSVVLSNSDTCRSISSLGLDQLRLAQEAEGRTKSPSFLLCYDFLDSSKWFHEEFATEASVLWSDRQSMSKRSLFRLVAWVGSEEEKEELKSMTFRFAQGHDDSFVFGEQPGGKLEVVVEVRPRREGRRDREDAWAGKAIESWR